MATFADAAQSAGIVITTEAVYGMMAHDFYTHRWPRGRPQVLRNDPEAAARILLEQVNELFETA